MDLGEAIMSHLENQARQQMLNQALFHLIKEQQGSVTVPLSILTGENMGGVIVEVDPKAETITLKTVDEAEAIAYAESRDKEHH